MTNKLVVTSNEIKSYIFGILDLKDKEINNLRVKAIKGKKYRINNLGLQR